jgi:3-isopropylmalate/(R)-2-methylmalate dehydratase large subunit
MNSIEKILANHSAVDVVKPGDVVVVDVDTTVYFDGIRTDIERIHDPDMVVALFDHQVPAPTVRAANHAIAMRNFVEKFGIKNYFPVGQHGISHVLVAQEGLALPGTILANPDSHTCSSGALNCLARGMGPNEMLYILCKGTTWYLVGKTTKVVLDGKLNDRVYPRDIIHYLPGVYGDFANRNLEWHGDGLANIDMDGRLTMATISAELSAEFSLFPYDDVLANYLEGRAKREFEPVFPDEDAEYEMELHVDLDALVPQVVLPNKVAKNVKPVTDVANEKIKVDQAFIGSCANGRLSDSACRDPEGPHDRRRRPHDRRRAARHPEAGDVSFYVERSDAARGHQPTCGACWRSPASSATTRCASPRPPAPGPDGQPQRHVYMDRLRWWLLRRSPAITDPAVEPVRPPPRTTASRRKHTSTRSAARSGSSVTTSTPTS